MSAGSRVGPYEVLHALDGNVVLNANADADLTGSISFLQGTNTGTSFDFVIAAVDPLVTDATTQTLTISGIGVSATAVDHGLILVGDDGLTLNAPISTAGRVNLIGDCGDCNGTFTSTDGVGTLTLNATVAATTSGGLNDRVDLSGADLVIGAAVTADDDVRINASADVNLNIGTNPGAGAHIDTTEINLLTAGTDLQFNSNDDGSIKVEGLVATDTDTITGTVQVNAAGNDGTGADVNFVGANLFNGAVSATAFNDVSVGGNLTSGGTGNLSLTTTNGGITFGSNVTVSAAGTLQLSAGTNLSSAAGTLTLVSTDGTFSLNDALRPPSSGRSCR